MTAEPSFAGRPLPRWYEDAKFGIFIHWGPYAVPCYAPVGRDMGEMMGAGKWEEAFKHSPYTEWYLNSVAIEGSPAAEHHARVHGNCDYGVFVDEFRHRSAGVDVAHWARLFADAGARYVVPVTKHHDGYLMWRSETPNPHRDGWMAERDHIGELAAAVRELGMRFGVYYSGGIDWTFVPPPITDFMSMVQKIPTDQSYCDYLLAHVNELIDRFSPDVLWNDIAWPFTLDPSETFARYYDKVPHGVVNDRWNLLAVRAGQLHADFSTPEYSTTADDTRKWEVCRGIGRSFGYNRMEPEESMPSVDELVWMLVDIVARGGNLLLNVGPDADGRIPIAQASRLLGVGWWLRSNGEAIYGSRPLEASLGLPTSTADGRAIRYTRGAERTYAIVEGSPAGTISFVDPQTTVSVSMPGNDRRLSFSTEADLLVIELPDHLPPSPATVFALESA